MIRRTIIVVAFVFTTSGTKAQEVQFYLGPAVGVSTLGPAYGVDLTVGKGRFATSIQYLHTGDDLIFDGKNRSFIGVSSGYMRMGHDRSTTALAGIGFMSGDDEDHSVPSLFGPRVIELERSLALMLRVDAFFHSSFLALGLSPFVLIGKSELTPGATVRLFIGKFR